MEWLDVLGSTYSSLFHLEMALSSNKISLKVENHSEGAAPKSQFTKDNGNRLLDIIFETYPPTSDKGASTKPFIMLGGSWL